MEEELKLRVIWNLRTGYVTVPRVSVVSPINKYVVRGERGKGVERSLYVEKSESGWEVAETELEGPKKKDRRNIGRPEGTRTLRSTRFQSVPAGATSD